MKKRGWWDEEITNRKKLKEDKMKGGRNDMRESMILRHLKINPKQTAQQNYTLLKLNYTCLLSFLYKKFILS